MSLCGRGRPKINLPLPRGFLGAAWGQPGYGRLGRSGTMTAVDPLLQSRKRGDRVIEGYGLEQVHVTHRGVVLPQMAEPRLRGDESQRPRLCGVVAGPAASEEPPFPFDHPLEDVVSVDRRNDGRGSHQGRGVGIVPRIAIGRRFISGPVVFGVQDRGLFSKAPLDAQGDDLAPPVAEDLGERVGDPGSHGMSTDGLLIGQGAQFEFH